MATLQQILDLARIYVDDNNKVTQGWKRPDDWLKVIIPEVLNAYRKWIRQGVISLETVDLSFIGPKVTISDSNVMVILGVVQSLGSGRFRLLRHAASTLGRSPFWDPVVGTQGVSTTWTASFGFFSDPGDGSVGEGVPSSHTILLHPPDTSTYIVRYIPEPFLSTLASVVYLPSGLEDLLAMRVARKMLASEGASSQAIEKLIYEAQGEWNMHSFSTSMGDGAKVRSVRPFNRHSMQKNNATWPESPSEWYFPNAF